jgi:hypothetical protein
MYPQTIRCNDVSRITLTQGRARWRGVSWTATRVENLPARAQYQILTWNLLCLVGVINCVIPHVIWNSCTWTRRHPSTPWLCRKSENSYLNVMMCATAALMVRQARHTSLHAIFSYCSTGTGGMSFTCGLKFTASLITHYTEHLCVPTIFRNDS